MRRQQHARVSRFTGLTADRIEATLNEFRETSLPFLEQQEGYEGIMVLANYAAGTAAALSLWESERHMRASEKLAEQARASAVTTGKAAKDPIVDHYEVIFTTVPVKTA
jgi:heme-degrading monooxygenase HmoA